MLKLRNLLSEHTISTKGYGFKDRVYAWLVDYYGPAEEFIRPPYHKITNWFLEPIGPQKVQFSFNQPGSGMDYYTLKDIEGELNVDIEEDVERLEDGKYYVYTITPKN